MVISYFVVSWPDNKIPIMKLILASLSVILLCSVFSCTKTNNVKTTVYDTTTQIFKDTTVIKDTVWEKTARNPIVGLWVGTFQVVGDAVDSFYYSFSIDSNGIMYTSDINASASSSSTGPWQLNGINYTASLTAMNGVTPENKQSVTAIYDSVAGTLSGQNVFTQGTGATTTFYFIRVQ